MMAIDVGDEVARHQQPDRLQVEVRRVVDAQPERLVRAVADAVAAVLAARALDGDARRGPGGTRSRRGSLAITGPSGIWWSTWSMMRMLCLISSRWSR